MLFSYNEQHGTYPLSETRGAIQNNNYLTICYQGENVNDF